MMLVTALALDNQFLVICLDLYLAKLIFGDCLSQLLDLFNTIHLLSP